jgi:hypothetical protein
VVTPASVSASASASQAFKFKRHIEICSDGYYDCLRTEETSHEYDSSTGKLEVKLVLRQCDKEQKRGLLANIRKMLNA